MLTRRVLVFSVALTLIASAGSSSGSSHPTWADISTAQVRPGVQVRTDSGGCTSNFIFYEPKGSGFDIYIGLAAHCFTLGGSLGSNGCTTPSRPNGSRAFISGALHEGTLSYSSWNTMKAVGETNSLVCGRNDFALVKLDPRDHGRVNPSMLFFGGPTALRTSITSVGEAVYSYGNSSLRLNLSRTSPKRGAIVSRDAWTHNVYTATPGVPGDSGSGMLDAQGRAIGVLVTLQIAPLVGSNGVTDMNQALNYARAKTGRTIHLALGTEPFEPRLV